jgi:hypothetical protein
MEVVGSSKMLINTYETTWYHNTGRHSQQFHCCENIKSDWHALPGHEANLHIIASEHYQFIQTLSSYFQLILQMAVPLVCDMMAKEP